MAKNSLNKVFDHLRHVLPLPGEDTLSDSELLTRFVDKRDQPAFAALLRRHGRMVMAVCQQVLRHSQDAEDAFQATFLLLSRKAKAVVKRTTLGGFLYEAAHRIALKARSLNSKRHRREKLMESIPPIGVPPEEIQDWRDLLYRELRRLPQKYREPIILCDLEGQPRKQVAVLLEVPEGTLSSRLSTARNKLAQRLARRGVCLSAGAIAMMLSEEAVAAQMISASLVVETTRAATLVAAGKMAAMSSPPAVLMKGVLKAMFLTKLKIVTGLLLAMGVLGAGSFAYRSGSGLQANPPESEILKELKALRKDLELVKTNLRVVAEQVQTQRTEIQQLKNHTGTGVGGIAKSEPGITSPLHASGRSAAGSMQQTDHAAVKAAVLILIDMLDKLPEDRVWVVEECLEKLAGNKAPAEIGASEVVSWPKVGRAWLEWWKGDKSKVTMVDADSPLYSLEKSLMKRAAPDPGNLQQHIQNEVGKILLFKVTGQAQSGGIWGTDMYTSDSSLAIAAVHAGVVQAGQTKAVCVKVLGPQANFVGSTRNGVTSSPFGNYPGAYQFVKPTKAVLREFMKK